MIDRLSSKGRGVFLSGWEVGFLAFFLIISLSACGTTSVSIRCSGVNVTCRSGKSPVLSPNATAQAQAVATMEAIKRDKPLLSDPLSSQDRNDWGNNSVCSFHDGAYFLTVNNFSGTESCDSASFGGHFGDVAIQVNLTLYSENSAAGLLFRATADLNEYYTFLINDGQFFLGFFGKNNTETDVIPYTSNSVVHGLGKINTLLVIAKGDDFRLFINGKFVAEGYDSTLTNGFVGVALSHTSSAKARFSNLIVYPA